MLNRAIYRDIENFFLNDKRALLISGARQTGKTYSIREVGSRCFERVIEINFIKQPEAVTIVSKAKDSDDLLLRLSLFSKKEFIPGKTLIFFDEVQECKEIVTAVKFLVEDGRYRYVLSGSLLGVELKDIRSVPVGYMSEMQMYPLDLEEFAQATGISSQVLNSLRRSYETDAPVDDFIHGRMLELVKLYLLVGGMPAAVQTYIDTNNLRSVYLQQRDIIKLYKKDFTKYQKEKKLEIVETYNLIPSELNSKNKRFIFKSLDETSRFSKYEESFLWLKDAGVAIPTYNVTEPRTPLLLNKQNNTFKLFLNDVGLLAASYAGDFQKRIMLDEINVNFGAIFENLAAQELYAHGFGTDEYNLFYFNSKKQGELDFVVEDCGRCIPVEVKSGKDYRRHQALNNTLSNTEYAIERAYVFCQDNLSVAEKITYLPIYMLMFFRKTEVDDTRYTFDLTGMKQI